MKGLQLALLYIVLAAFLPIQVNAQQKVINATVLMGQKKAPDNQQLIKLLKSQWKVQVDSVTISDKTLVFNSFGGCTVMVAYLDYPAATDETGAAARLSWMWRNGAEIAARHQAQIVISVIGATGKTLDLYKVMTQTTAAVLELTQAPAVFQQAQYLLHDSGYFINAARNMITNQSLPVYCWVYFGRPGEGNGFTYGLTEFGIPEMEIVASSHPESEVHATLFDAVLTILQYNTKLNDGQSFVTGEGTKLVAKFGKSAFVKDDQTVIQLEY
ncbi:MAG: DUF4261 domain-containing protein [Saprospiraceae bacterium]|nr:DUF4261 domain-containing protein [Saprospiraceae bacterium]